MIQGHRVRAMEITARVNSFYEKTTSGTVRDLALNRERDDGRLYWIGALFLKKELKIIIIAIIYIFG